MEIKWKKSKFCRNCKYFEEKADSPQFTAFTDLFCKKHQVDLNDALLELDELDSQAEYYNIADVNLLYCSEWEENN